MDLNLCMHFGHGVGLEVHEGPVIHSRNEKALKIGMVVTDEPGIYIPGNFGIRIEDTVLITEKRCRNTYKIN